MNSHFHQDFLMKTISMLAMLVCWPMTESLSQPDLNGRFELGGGLSYSSFSAKTFGQEGKGQSVAFQPNVGLFLTSAFEVSLGGSVSYSSMEQNGLMIVDGAYYFSYGIKTETFGLSVNPGIRYHVLVSDVVVPYLALSAQLSWQRLVFDSYSKPWSKPSVVAPTLDAGIRFFLSSDWALQLGFRYSRTVQFLGDPDVNQNGVSFGTGFAIFL